MHASEDNFLPDKINVIHEYFNMICVIYASINGKLLFVEVEVVVSFSLMHLVCSTWSGQTINILQDNFANHWYNIVIIT